MSNEVGTRRRRPPSLYALGIVILTTLVGFGLFFWGPVNPNVEVGLVDSEGGPQGASRWAWAMVGSGGSFGNRQDVGTSGRVTTDLTVTNHSLASIRLTKVRLESARSDDPAMPTITRTQGVPADVGRGAPAKVTVTVDVREWCNAYPGQDFDYRLLIDATTSWGVTRTFGHNVDVSVGCTQDVLPPAGNPPADPAQDRAQILSAFSTAYGNDVTPERRRASVDDPVGLAEVVRAAQTGPNASALQDLRVDIAEVVFTSPTEAAVHYDLEGDQVTYASGRIGHVHRVDGHWKVTRETVCGDLGMAGVTCPSS